MEQVVSVIIHSDCDGSVPVPVVHTPANGNVALCEGDVFTLREQADPLIPRIITGNRWVLLRTIP